MKLDKQDLYQYIIDFIDVVIESADLMRWLVYLEALPDNLRSQQLVKMKRQMLSNNESAQIIGIVESINKPKVLHAINAVINDVHETGMKTRQYIRKHDSLNFKTLISLMAPG